MVGQGEYLSSQQRKDCSAHLSKSTFADAAKENEMEEVDISVEVDRL